MCIPSLLPFNKVLYGSNPPPSLEEGQVSVQALTADPEFKLLHLFFKSVPIGLGKDNPENKSHPPLSISILSTSGFYGLSVLTHNYAPLPAVFGNMTALVTKNTIRTGEQYFENLVKFRGGAAPQGALAHIKKFKYLGLSTAVLIGYAFDGISGGNLHLGDAALGISAQILERELNLFLKNKGKNANGAKVDLGRPLIIRISICSAATLAAFGATVTGRSMILVDGALGLASTAFKHIVLDTTIDWRKALAPLWIGAPLGYLADYGIRYLQSKQWADFSSFFKEGSLLNIGPNTLTLALKAHQQIALRSTFGPDYKDDDDDDESENAVNKDQSNTPPKKAAELVTIPVSDPSLGKDVANQPEPSNGPTGPATSDSSEITVLNPPGDDSKKADNKKDKKAAKKAAKAAKKASQYSFLPQEPLPVAAQRAILAAMVVASYGLLYLSQQSVQSVDPTSHNQTSPLNYTSTPVLTSTSIPAANQTSLKSPFQLTANMVTQTTVKMFLWFIRGVPQCSSGFALGASSVTIAGDTVAYMYKNELPTFTVVAAIFMTMIGAYVAKNVVKNYQLGRKFTVASNAEASQGGYTQVPTQN